MLRPVKINSPQFILLSSIAVLILLSFFVLRSIAPGAFPIFFVYLGISIVVFTLFLGLDIDILTAFSTHLYVLCILLLVLTLIIGQVTRGVVRWIPLGSITIQASEVVKPFLILFFAIKVASQKQNVKSFLKLLLLFFLPFVLILVQPSLGVSILVSTAFLGILLASNIKKKYIFSALSILVLIIPLIFLILAPYQKDRVRTFLLPATDPLGGGYNSIQSMIAVGSGGVIGRGFGKGVQTQLYFLPAKQTDFIFAAISEEFGFVGAGIALLSLFVFFLAMVQIAENNAGPTQRTYITGVIVILLAQTVINIGMNMGLLPITGVPLPFVSLGGSSLISNMIAVAIVIKSKKSYA